MTCCSKETEIKSTGCCSKETPKTSCGCAGGQSSHNDGPIDTSAKALAAVMGAGEKSGSSCCGSAPKTTAPSCCADPKAPKKFDFLMWGSLAVILPTGLGYLFGIFENYPRLHHMGHSVADMLASMWWGILLGMVFVGLLAKIPREFIMSILGQGGTFGGLLRATGAGVLLDLCSHGILMVGAKLYERGASAGQVIAFLLASPWNSFSLTLILIGLIGFKFTMAFIVLSCVIAIATGWIFDRLVVRGTLPPNPYRVEIPENFDFWKNVRTGLSATKFDQNWLKDVILTGIRDSQMVIRWLAFGILLAALLRAFVDPASFERFFGPTLIGLVITIFVATILEVCSEGSAPIAADITIRASAPGNGFAFLMAGVATDYTEVMVLKDTTRSWKIALFLPLITLPQVILVAWLINLAT